VHLKAIAMNDLIYNGGGLFRTIRIQVHPVAVRVRFLRDCQESCTVPNAGIDHGEWRSREAKAGPDPSGFIKRQRKVSQPQLSLDPHECSPFASRLDRYPPLADNGSKWS
jgi:hypothetical protein